MPSSIGSRVAPALRAEDVMDVAPGWCLVVDEDWHVVTGNAAARRAVEAGSAQGARRVQPCHILDCAVTARDPDAGGKAVECGLCGIHRAFRRSLSGETASAETTLTGASGRQIEFDVRARPIRLPGMSGAVLSIVDARDRKRREVLEHALLHDVMDSVTAVYALMQMLDSDGGARFAKSLVPTIRTHVEGLADEILAQRAVLDAERGLLNPVISPTDTTALLDRLFESFAPTAEREGIPIGIEHDPNAPHALPTDPVLVRRVVGGMIRNAIEASSAGERISFGCSEVDPDHAEFWVRNAAVMPPLTRMQIFQRSFSTKGPGRGIGTYAIRLIGEEALGGRVGFTSSAPEGTRFYLRIPLRRKPAPPSHQAPGPGGSMR